MTYSRYQCAHEDSKRETDGHWATRASTAIPGVLPPVIEGSDILVDGGVLNNLPVDFMSEMRRGPIIAVDASNDYGLQTEQPGTCDLFRSGPGEIADSLAERAGC